MGWQDIPLGRSSAYQDSYDAELLCPLPRAENRGALLGEGESWPWHGGDVWNAYELSWLRGDGVPQVAMARFTVPASSPYLVESKSLKLYLNGFSATRFDDHGAVRDRIERDLTTAAGAEVAVELFSVDEGEALLARPPQARLIDHVPVSLPATPDDASILACAEGEPVAERLCSHLLRSLCPVTGQPDWASLVVDYRGAPIQPDRLLRYLIGFRGQQDFHEHCVERIFVDILRQCAPQSLRVRAFYTRRGGLDINPWRSTEPEPPAPLRLRRQ